MEGSAASVGPFSRPNRLRLIDEYFADRTVEPATAWMDVYRLLLWVDGRTGVAHCYESDKSQPGRPWYTRSLEFHEWLSEHFGVRPRDLAEEIDWMFRRVIRAVTEAEANESQRLALRDQDKVFSRHELPVPGDDATLVEIVEPLMAADPADRPSPDVISEVLRRVQVYLKSENKRANLLGRGFEDVLAGVIQRLPDPPTHWGIQTPLETIPGFRAARTGDKAEKVDLWAGDGAGRRVLVSAKWSVRADREKQMRGDFLTYVAANELREPFEYVWITNEFDPARLVANATNTEANRQLFDAVVHVCPEALRIVHQLDAPRLGRNPTLLRELLDAGRVIGLADWLTKLSN